jgi:hypothetical protein
MKSVIRRRKVLEEADLTKYLCNSAAKHRSEIEIDRRRVERDQHRRGVGDWLIPDHFGHHQLGTTVATVKAARQILAISITHLRANPLKK